MLTIYKRSNVLTAVVLLRLIETTDSRILGMVHQVVTASDRHVAVIPFLLLSTNLSQVVEEREWVNAGRETGRERY